MPVGDTVFVGYPDAVHYKTPGQPGKTKGKTPINQLLWGDWARVEALDGDWVQVRCRRRTGWVHEDNLQAERILEVNFVDIGQGDGCHIQTPDDRALVIDAGEGDNMFRFLRWRFGRFQRPFAFEAFVITHPDKDHYFGFQPFLRHDRVSVGALFHNGIVEQVVDGEGSLGAEAKVDGKRYLTGLVQTLAELRSITGDDDRRGNRVYPNMLKVAVESGRVGDIQGLLASRDRQNPRYLPGFGPGDNRGLTLKVLGPVPAEPTPGQQALPRLGKEGETKNGHSVVLLLEMGHIRMLLGGDLNEPAQKYLLRHYTGLDPEPRTPTELETLVAEGAKHLGVDLAKACHHGSADVLPAFLQATNTLITVVSSGDNEPHSHPRPDTLGMIGKLSRSDRPLIFSTELARSGNESITHPNQVRAELMAKINAESAIIYSPTASDQEKAAAGERLEKALEVIERSVANYGMINVRTDGRRMIVAQRLERKRSKAKRWDIYRFEADAHGRVGYVR